MARTFYFSEDFRAELQFSPRENMNEVLGRLSSFAAVDIQSGIKDYDCRPFGVSVEVRSIPFSSVDSVFCDILHPYTEVRFDISREETKEDMFAFGTDNIVLSGGYDNRQSKLVSWFSFFKYAGIPDSLGGERLLSRLVGVTEIFCLQYDLLLVDLDARLIVDFCEHQNGKELFRNWLCLP